MTPWSEVVSPLCSDLAYPGSRCCTSQMLTSSRHKALSSLLPCSEGDEIPKVQVTLKVFGDLGTPPQLGSVFGQFQ